MQQSITNHSIVQHSIVQRNIVYYTRIQVHCKSVKSKTTIQHNVCIYDIYIYIHIFAIQVKYYYPPENSAPPAPRFVYPAHRCCWKGFACATPGRSKRAELDMLVAGRGAWEKSFLVIFKKLLHDPPLYIYIELYVQIYIYMYLFHNHNRYVPFQNPASNNQNVLCIFTLIAFFCLGKKVESRGREELSSILCQKHRKNLCLYHDIVTTTFCVMVC